VSDRFFTVSVDIPQVDGIGDLFQGLMLCNTGAIVVAYKRQVIIDNINVADESLAFDRLRFGAPAGARIALDVRVPNIMPPGPFPFGRVA